MSSTSNGRPIRRSSAAITSTQASYCLPGGFSVGTAISRLAKATISSV
jgi:hypothetical protein